MTNTVGQTHTGGARGFSLIELLIAMTVTLIVSGAVLSVLLEGNRAFKTQPELSERQQNIRAAMDMIMRDIANAGAGLPLRAQVFSRQVWSDGGLKSAHDGGIASPAGWNTDLLEMLTNSAGIDPVPGCSDNGVNVRVRPNFANFAVGMPVIIIMEDGTYSIRAITAVQSDNSSSGTCTGGTRPRLVFNQGQDATGRNPSGGVCGLDSFGQGTNTQGNNQCRVREIGFQDVVAYRIFVAPDDGVPVLQRSSLAGCPPGAASRDGCWQTVARGIEDMQVTYRDGAAIVANALATDSCASPEGCDLPLDLPDDMMAVAANNTNGMLNATTVMVQVELAARGNLLHAEDGSGNSGEVAMMTTAGGSDTTRAFRGRLVSRGTPRSAVVQFATYPSPVRWQ